MSGVIAMLFASVLGVLDGVVDVGNTPEMADAPPSASSFTGAPPNSRPLFIGAVVSVGCGKKNKNG